MQNQHKYLEQEQQLQQQQDQPQQHQDVIALATGEEVGAWQWRRLPLALAMVVPGLAHIFLSVFGMAYDSFHCADQPDGHNGEEMGEIVNGCSDHCSNYEFDRSFWQDSITMQFQLVCDRSSLACK